MLSRFTLRKSNMYPKENIEAAVAQIKKLARPTTNNAATKQAISKILGLMKKYTDSLHIQRVACHSLSNLAMQVMIASWIIQQNGFKLIKTALSKFDYDEKLCWLGSSAVWNLARPPRNRALIGKDGVRLMFHILKIHRKTEKVTNTTIGALSNLSLCEELKDIIAEQKHVELVLSVLTYYCQQTSVSVMTSGAGLLANLAVSDAHASLLVKHGALATLFNLLQWSCNEDNTIYRNTCAALNNMVTAEHFLESLLHCRGVETLFDFLKNNEEELFTNLLENCLVNIDVDAKFQTTSFHLSCMHGKLSILKSLINAYPKTNLDILDEKQMTCLDYAITNGHSNIVEFLSKCGAIEHQTNFEDEDNKLRNAIEKGKATLNHVAKCNKKAIYNSCQEFPEDICKLAVSFVSNLDMLQAMDQF